MGAWSLSPWTSREVPQFTFFVLLWLHFCQEPRTGWRPLSLCSLLVLSLPVGSIPQLCCSLSSRLSSLKKKSYSIYISELVHKATASCINCTFYHNYTSLPVHQQYVRGRLAVPSSTVLGSSGCYNEHYRLAGL